MIIILSMFFCCLLISVFYECFVAGQSTESYNMLKFIIFIAILLAAFRGEIARDYAVYIEIYQQIPPLWDLVNDFSLVETVREEIGYIVLNSVIKQIFNDYIFVFIAMATMSLFLYYFSFKRYSHYPVLSFFIYFSLFYLVKEFTQMRHGLAIAIFFFSLQYCIEKKLIKYLFLNAVASLFHQAIIPVIPIYFLRNFKWDTKKYVIFTMGCLLLYQMSWIEALLSLLSSSDIGIRILLYQGTEYVSEGNPLRIVKYLGLFFVFIFFLQKKNLDSKESIQVNLFLNMIALAIFYMSLFHEFIILGDRFASALLMAVCILFPMLLTKQVTGEPLFKRMIILLMIFIICLASFLNNFDMLIGV